MASQHQTDFRPRASHWPRARNTPLAINRLLQNPAPGPEEIERLMAAYEQTLAALGLKDRSDSLTNLVAKRIIEIGQTGIKDPAEISRLAIATIGKRL